MLLENDETRLSFYNPGSPKGADRENVSEDEFLESAGLSDNDRMLFAKDVFSHSDTYLYMSPQGEYTWRIQGLVTLGCLEKLQGRLAAGQWFDMTPYNPKLTARGIEVLYIVKDNWKELNH